MTHNTLANTVSTNSGSTEDSASTSASASANNNLVEPTHSTNSKTEICKNCNTALSGPFCHQCGQPSKSIIRFFGSLITELLEDIISLDSRALRTFGSLLFRPGFLTKEYVSGRRFSYVPPLRLFLITSIFCIFIVWLLNKTGDLKITEDDLNESQTVGQVSKEDGASPELVTQAIESPKLDHLSEAEKEKVKKDIEQSNTSVSLKDDESNDLVTQGSSDEDLPTEDEDVGIRIDSKSDKVSVSLPFLSEEENQSLENVIEEKYKQAKEDPRELIGDFLEMIPKSMLLFVPIFALIMRLAYPFARRYYIEHLIHAFHGHSFLFLSIILIIGLGLAGTSLEASASGLANALGSVLKFIEAVLFIWIPIYYLLSLLRVYEQHWLLTLFKWFLLGIAYLILSAFSGVLVLIASLLLG